MQKKVVDHLHREIEFSFPPKRIISLCPSITETLYALGLEVAGRTRYCIHPGQQVEKAVIVGGTKQVKREKIDELKPDLIIVEKEENPKDMVEDLASQYPVFVANVESYGDALKMIKSLGELTGTEKMAEDLIDKIDHGFKALSTIQPRRKVAYLIWKNPYMVAGHSTFINAMLETCGWENVFKHQEGRYPTIEIHDLKQASPDYIFLSSEPYPFQTSHAEELVKEYPDARPILVDGEMFSWYGVRMIKAFSYFQKLTDQLKSEDENRDD